MTHVKHYIGIDVSKNWLDIAVISPLITTPLELKCDNSINELKKLKKVLGSYSIPFDKSTLVTCEHTGLYKKLLVDFLLRQRCRVCVEVPQRIKKSLGIQRGKNDQIDARRIAEYSQKNEQSLTIWKKPRKIIVRLKDLLKNRDRLSRSMISVEVPLAEWKHFYTRTDYTFLHKMNVRAIKGLKDSLDLIETEIVKITKEDKPIKQQIKLLLSVPGVGLITALHLICYTYEFTICKSANQLACYAGIAPFEHSSGSSVKGKSRVSHIANKKLKSLLHLGALSQIRARGAFKDYYTRKVAEGKNKMLVINAVRNKIIHRVAAVINRGTPYVKNLKTVVS